MGVERKAARKLRTQGGQSAASVNKSWAKHRLRCANAAHAAQPTAAARRPGPRSLAGDIRQASGSARSSHAMRFYHLPLGSWLMLSLHQAGAKGRGRMLGGRCAHGTHPQQCAVQQVRQPAHGREQVYRCVRLVAGVAYLHMGVQPAQAASAVAMVDR